MLKQIIKKSLFFSYIQIHRLFFKIGVLPYNKNFGIGRGKPVGRYYIEKFLRYNSKYIIGRCLEFGNDRYKPLFPKVEQYEIISLTQGPKVSIVCDIHKPTSDLCESFDSVICTQVFEHLAYPEIAAKSIFYMLRNNGVLLLTVPFINNIHYAPTDFRRFTPDGVKLILEDAGFYIERLEFGGNAMVATGSLLGMVSEDFSMKEMEIKDHIYPYNILVRARRPAQTESKKKV